MTDLKVELLPWQQDVFADKTRFKVIAAGRRTGKSRLAAWLLIINALNEKSGQVFYVAPTQGQARDIMWSLLLDLGHGVIASSHVNNLHIKLVNGCTIALKGADRPETMRGVSLKFLCLDEYADMKPEVWEQILRPALADQKGHALFIGTPMGRNHFYDLYTYANLTEDDPDFKSWHFTSFDNPLLDPKEIKAAEKSMSRYSYRQEFLASFEAQGSELFKEEHVIFCEEEPDEGEYYVSVDLAGFIDVNKNKTKSNRLDETAISVVKAGTEGWWVSTIVHGRWGVKETARKIFEVVRDYSPVSVGIEKGALKNAVLPYISDLMKKNQRFFRIEELTHGNKKKTDRVVWALQGRFEHGNIKLNKGSWNTPFLDQLFQFPSPMVHDDLIDSLAYIDQLAQIAYNIDYEEEDYEFTDAYAGY
jgi:phage terminase large subunit-like protein|tara:strand:- start:1527 stop:2783 length:1257 start_codon:yes stop_codon:yes gene_type:complete